MSNILKPLKNIIKVHDAAVNSGTIDNEKLGKYIPSQFSSGYTGSTLQSIAKAGSHLKRVKIITVKSTFLLVTLAGHYISMQNSPSVALANRACVIVEKPLENLNIANALNPMFKYYKGNQQKKSHPYNTMSQKSLIDIVKEKNLSTKK